MSIDKKDLALKILSSSQKKNLKNSDLDGLLENYIVNKASEEESIYLAKHGFNIIEAMESLLLDRKYSNKKPMKNVKESASADFFMKHSSDIEEAKKDIRSLRKMMIQLPEAFFAEWEDDPKDPLKKCDYDIADYIMKLSMLPDEPINIDELFRVTDKNYIKNGTERHFIFDYIKAFKKYIETYMKNHDILGEIDNTQLNETSDSIYPDGFSNDYGWTKCVEASDGNEGIAYIVADVLMHKMSFEDACENQNYYGDRKDIVRDRNIARKALKSLGYKGNLKYFNEEDINESRDPRIKVESIKSLKENEFKDTAYTTSLWDILDKINIVKRAFGDKKALMEAYDIIYAEIRKEMGE